MTTNDEILAALAKLEKSSRIAIPLSLFAFIAIMGMLYFSGRELLHTRQQIEAAKRELAQVIAETQARLREVDGRIADATANKEWALNLQKAREGIAVADASLTGTKMQITAPKASATAARPRYGATSVDIFYCENSGESAKDMAARIATLKGDNAGNWRVRTLPANVNASDGYRISSNVVRFNPDETDVAQALMDDARKLTGLSFRPQEIAYPTPNYISAFICQPAQAAQSAKPVQSAKPAQAAPPAQSAQPAKTEEKTDSDSGFSFTFGFGGESRSGGRYKSTE